MNEFQISIQEIKSRGVDLFKGLLYKFPIDNGKGEIVAAGSQVHLKLRMIVKGETILQYSKQAYSKIVEQILPTGLSLAVRQMRVGEHSIIWMDKTLAFGINRIIFNSQCQLPKRTAIVFDVTVERFLSKEDIPLSFRGLPLNDESLSTIHRQLEAVELLMEKNRKGEAFRTLKTILRRTQLLITDAKANPVDEENRKKLLSVLTHRTAAFALELGRYPQAVTLSKDALQLEPFSAQANYICGCAYFALGFYTMARRYVRAAHHSDLRNPIYERKLRDIDRHCALLERDVDYDSDQEEYEDFASYLLEKIIANEKKFKKTIAAFINDRLEKGFKSLYIGGGFRDSFLEHIAAKIARNKYIRIGTPSGSLRLDF